MAPCVFGRFPYIDACAHLEGHVERTVSSVALSSSRSPSSGASRRAMPRSRPSSASRERARPSRRVVDVTRPGRRRHGDRGGLGGAALRAHQPRRPEAKAANLTGGASRSSSPSTPSVIRPRGLYIVDTGRRARACATTRRAPRSVGSPRTSSASTRSASATDTASWLAAQQEPAAGVFLTHLHVDHVSGMRDSRARPSCTRGPARRASGTSQPVRAPHRRRCARGQGRRPRVAVHGPIRTARSRVSSTSSATARCGRSGARAHRRQHGLPRAHAYGRRSSSPATRVTRCGAGSNGVEPGTYSSDQPRSRASLDRLRAFAAEASGDGGAGRSRIREAR